MKSVSKYLLASALLVLAILLFIFTMKKNPADDVDRVDTEKEVRISRPVAGTIRPPEKMTQEAAIEYPQMSEILDMGPADWENKFQTEYQNLDKKYKTEVILLAGELQDSLQAGANKGAEETEAYAETILLLLQETENSDK